MGFLDMPNKAPLILLLELFNVEIFLGQLTLVRLKPQTNIG